MSKFYKNSKEIKRKKSTPRQIFFMIVWMCIFSILFFEVLKIIGYTLGKVDREKMYVYNFVNEITQNIMDKSVNTINEESKLKVAVLGNIYLTSDVISASKSNGSYYFSDGQKDVENKLSKYDVVFASLLTPVAGSGLGFSTSQKYNAPDELLDTLKKLNVSAVATASSRAMDKGINGIKNTVEKLEKSEILQTGISDTKKLEPLVITKNNISIGVLSYATKSNVSISKDNVWYVNYISEEKVKKDAEILKQKNVDVVIAFLDVPNGDTTIVTSTQKDNSELLIQNGVNIVICSGTNTVLESYEDNINGSKIFVSYSLGDFMGAYNLANECTSVVPTFEFTKNIKKDENGNIINTTFETKVNKSIKLWTQIKNNQKQVYIMDEEIEKFNLGKSSLTNNQYSIMKNQYDRIISLVK